MQDVAGPIRNPQKARFHQYFPRSSAIDAASFEAMFPMLCLRWAKLGVKLSPKGPKLCRFGHDYAWALGPIWANFEGQPGPKLAQVGLPPPARLGMS